MNDENEFTYEYSAERQKEIQDIRQKYSAPQTETSKLDELRRLDKKVDNAGRIISLTVGIIGTFVLGLGMCCCIEWSDRFFIHGIIIGLIGIALLAAAYPLNSYLVKRKREKLTPYILKLTDELSDM